MMNAMPAAASPTAIPFTQAAFDDLKQEKQRLTTERKAVLLRLQEAREMGDLSENGAYTYAKFELGSINRQLRQLNHLLKYGFVAKANSSSRIGFGSQVTLQTAQGKHITYTLVSIHESNLVESKLSTESPLGAALMSKQAGEVVTVQAPAGTLTYTIVSVS